MEIIAPTRVDDGSIFVFDERVGRRSVTWYTWERDHHVEQLVGLQIFGAM